MSDRTLQDKMREIPSVERMLQSDRAGQWLENFPRSDVVWAVRKVLEEIRESVRKEDASVPDAEELSRRVAMAIRERRRMGLRRVINATGILLHTNLGRAPMAEEVREALEDVVGCCNLQIDLDTGKRSSRGEAVLELFRELSGAEDALVVNNNAGATFLTLRALAAGREVIVSRGQLIEIGGSFRLPDVMAESGATLVEVGSTNKTHLRDYENAITERTALLFRAHPSNYRIVGFSKEVPIEELVPLGKKHGIPVVDDLGSGALIDLARYGLPSEPLVRKSIEAGADVVLFSTDKLIGGPQGGAILGKKELLQRIRKHPLARALRVGKLTLAALEATLRLFRDPDTLVEKNPTIRMLTESPESIRERALHLVESLKKEIPDIEAVPSEDVSHTGGGSLPMEDLPTWSVVMNLPGYTAESLARTLREQETPIISVVRDDHVRMDLRTVRKEELGEIVETFRTLSRKKCEGRD